MRMIRAALAAALAAAALALPAYASIIGSKADQGPKQRGTPPGQIAVVTVNAKQDLVLDVERFERLYELARALRSRPPAFDGGSSGAVQVPDIIVVQEMRESNAEIFQRLLRQNYSYRFSFLGDKRSAAKFLVNEDTIQLQGDTVTWADACGASSDGSTPRQYQFGRFVEKDSAAPFVVAGFELRSDYGAETERCVTDNVQALRNQLEGEQAPAIIAGDFNRRSVTTPRECDPSEGSQPAQWWSLLTAPSAGRVYVDAVRASHSDHGATVANEWTHEARKAAELCDGRRGLRRARIDYLFASAAAAAAHADHPGWSGGGPGTLHPDNYRYSDHRFVWGRFVVSGPSRLAAPTAVARSAGAIDVAWPLTHADGRPIEGMQALILYRAARRHAYQQIARLAPDTTTYTDSATVHGRHYRYVLVPVGIDGGHGVESVAARARADALGPTVTRVRPRAGSSGIDRRVTLRAVFNEPIDSTSVGAGTFELLRNGRRPVTGRVTVGRRVIEFDPYAPLKANRRFTAIVRPVRDALGNRGQRFSWTFRT